MDNVQGENTQVAKTTSHYLCMEGGDKESHDRRPTCSPGETSLHPAFRAVLLTAGEDQRAGVLVHGEVMQLQLALCVNGEPAGGSQGHCQGQPARNQQSHVITVRGGVWGDHCMHSLPLAVPPSSSDVIR